MATIAVFLALAGVGVAATKIAKKSVGTKQLKNGAVSTKKLKNKAVTQAKLGGAAVTNSKLGGNAVSGDKIATNAVGTDEILDGSVTRAKVSDNAIPFLGTLRSGQTLRGVFDIGETVGPSPEFVDTGYSFQFPLENAPSAPAANVIDATGLTPTFTPACPGISGGNQQTPNAAPGNLCVYMTSKSAVGSFDTFNVTRLGFGLTLVSNASPGLSATGFWAVTAP